MGLWKAAGEYVLSLSTFVHALAALAVMSTWHATRVRH